MRKTNLSLYQAHGNIPPKISSQRKRVTLAKACVDQPVNYAVGFCFEDAHKSDRCLLALLREVRK